MGRTNTLRLRTPEGVTFSYELASPVIRCLAWLVDAACISVASSLVGGALSVLNLTSADLARAVILLVYFVISVGYGIALEWAWRGQTLGKRLLRLQVLDEGGLRIRFQQIVVRNLLRFLDALPVYYLVGGVASLISPRGQRLGDLAAGTVVVRHRPLQEPDLDQLLAGKFNSFRNHPHLEARLRQLTSPMEADLPLRALLRRDQLDPPGRVRLFAELAAHFQQKVEFPESTTLGLTDEQYVRNLVEVLFRTPRSHRNKTTPSADPAPRPEIAGAAENSSEEAL